MFLYSAQGSFSWPRVDLARLLRQVYTSPFWITSFEFVKVYGFRFSIWESFLGFSICCYPITTILTCLFSVRVRISWKKLCWMRAWRRRWHLVSPTLYITIVYRVNLNKLSQNFVGALRTTTTNCRVSFLDLYLVFPRNFRIVFLPHTNTVIVLERYCGTISQSLGYLWINKVIKRGLSSYGLFTRRWGTPDRWGNMWCITPLSCKHDQIKMKDYMHRRVTLPQQVASPTWGPPPPSKQVPKPGSWVPLPPPQPPIPPLMVVTAVMSTFPKIEMATGTNALACQ